MSAVAFQPTAFGTLIHCANAGVTGWGSRRCVWAAFDYSGAMLTWSANKRHCRATAEKTGKRFLLCKVSGIEDGR